MTEVEDPTGKVVTVKPSSRAPAETVMLAGTDAAAAFELERVTVAPPAGAGSNRVTVPTTTAPPVTPRRESSRRATPGPVTFRKVV